MFDYRGWFVGINTQSMGHFFINSVTSYYYDAADVMENGNYATVLEMFCQYIIAVSNKSQYEEGFRA